MMKMSFLFLYVSLINVLIVSGLQQNYHDILINVNNLPNFVKYLEESPDFVSYAADLIGKSAGISSIDFARQHAVEDNITTTVSPVPVMSALCVNQTTAIAMALFDRQKWAEKMIDATGKLPADVLDGDVTWLGDYDECLSVHSNLTSYPGNLKEFNGEYCLVGIPVPGPINPMTQQGPMIQIGICVPDSCTEADTVIMLNSALSRLSNNTLLAKTSTCQEPDRKFDTRAVIVMVIVLLFITVMVIATAYDIIWIHWPKWQTENISAMLNGELADNFDRRISSEEVKPLLGNKVTEEYRPGIGHKILLSFSIYTNGAKILSTTQPAGSLSAVNGIRFISLTWVILGHTYAFLVASGDNIAPFIVKMMKRWTFQAILNALVSVDTFFTLSGLLLTYLTMRELKRCDGKLNWLLFYFHRFWRLTPPYMLILMVYVSLFPYIGSGPMWKKDGMEYNYCKDAWYYNILYINNFVSITDPSKQCMAWSWYLANDMQFFVVSPLIIIPLFYSKVAGMIVMFVFLLGTWIATGVISSHYKMSPTLLLGNGNFQEYFEFYYERPYCRIGPYLVGMFTGYLLYRMNCKCRINRYVNLILWAIATALAITILYGLYDEVNGHPMSTEVAALYNTVHRTLWGACVCWVIFACATGNGGFVNTFLSWKAFIPLGRLTYCAYLIHPIIIYYYVNSQHRLVHFSDVHVIYLYLGNLCLAYAASFIASLAFESPMMGLEKIIFKREKKD